MNRSSSLIDSNRWRQACNFLGCSFELAEWLLDNPQLSTQDNLRPMDRFMVTGHQLAECMGRSEREDLELHFLLTVHLRLVDWVKHRRPEYWLLKQHLQISLAMLNRYSQRRGGFKGYYDCCVEAEWYIKQCIN